MSPLSGKQPVPAARGTSAAAAAVAVRAWPRLEPAAAAVARERVDVAESVLTRVAATAVAAVALLCISAHDCAAEASPRAPSIAHRRQPAVPVDAGACLAWQRSVPMWPAQAGSAPFSWLALPCTSTAAVCVAWPATCVPKPACLAAIWPRPARCRPWARETAGAATASHLLSLPVSVAAGLNGSGATG